jgi:hypothetical protein
MFPMEGKICDIASKISVPFTRTHRGAEKLTQKLSTRPIWKKKFITVTGWHVLKITHTKKQKKIKNTNKTKHK